MRVLVVEDDDSIAEPLAEGLTRIGFEVTRVPDGASALDAGDTDVVLLDLNLPDIDGFNVCKALRERSDVPIVCLTARMEEADRVRGLELGADDYVVKPFGFNELVARIRAVTRRRRPRDNDQAIRCGDLRIDRRTRDVTIDGRAIELTPKEFAVLVAIARHGGAVVERATVLEEAWDQPWYGPTKTLDVHVASLRKKLGDARWITAMRGVGFRLVDPAASDP